MSEPTPAPGRLWPVLLGVLVVATVVAGTGFWVAGQTDRQPPPVKATPVSGAKPFEPVKPAEVGGRPLFADWPKENPDLVIVVSGQTFGYLSPCGCSRPQYGGLERRYNLIQWLKGKGWEVIGLDAGDVAAPPGKGLKEQALKKYHFTMKALQEMGYVAVGLGKTDFQNDLMQLLGEFTVNNAGKRPVVLSANLAGGAQRNPMNKNQVLKATAREDYFKVPNGRPLVEDVEVVTTGKGVTVGVIATVGPTVAQELVEVDPSYTFEPNATVLPAALKKLAAGKAKPDLRVLLYQGTKAEAKQVAKDFPDIQLIVCTGDAFESDPPPLFPEKVAPEKADGPQVVVVGQKGKHVGLVGVFKTAAGLDLRYQLVPLGEEYLTPNTPEAAADNKALQLLERYTKELKDGDFLAKAVKKQGEHVASVQTKTELKYVGVQACAKCHAAEAKKWGETKHAHAYEALEKEAKRPSLRQFDPECVTCHSTGFEYKTGFQSAALTKELLHNACENCHGPGSGHAEKPNDKELLKRLAPWKLNKDDKLPDLKTLEKIAAVPEGERGKVEIDTRHKRLVTAIGGTVCMRCHDGDNDPKFDVWTYLPKVYHSGLKQNDLPDIGK